MIFSKAVLLGLGVWLWSLPAWAQQSADAGGQAPVPATADSMPPALLQAAGSGAAASTPAAAEQQAGVRAAPAQLEEIIVTATKRSQSVREIPSTINVLTGAKLESMGARDMSDFFDLVPGIKLAQAAGSAPDMIAVRGVGPDTTTNQTVATVLGDVPMTDPYSSLTMVDPDPWDMKTVEVLKGPQGTLFGASSLNGIIRYVPNEPALGQWEGKGFAEWVAVKDGGFEPTFGGALNMPVGNSLALRLSGVGQHQPGDIDYVNPSLNARNGNDFHKWAGRGMALWQPFHGLTINAWYMHQQQNAEELSFVNNQNAMYERLDAPGPSPNKTSFSLATLDVRYAFDWATVVYLGGWQSKQRNFDLEGTYDIPGEKVAELGLSLTRGLQLADAKGFVQELRLVSRGDGPWTWLAGGFFSSYRADLYAADLVPNTSQINQLTSLLPFNLGSAIADGNGINEAGLSGAPFNAGERALFGELGRSFWDSLKLTLGARLYRTDVGGTEVLSGALPFATSLQTDRSTSLAVASKGFSPKFSLSYRLDPEVLFYATASRGFQYGGVNFVPFATDHVPPTFGSSTLWNYEAGIRTDWLERTLRFDLTAFYIDWKNAQVTQSTQPYDDNYVSNVAAVRNRGFESSFRYLPPFVPGLSLDLAGSYVESKTLVPFVAVDNHQVPAGTVMPNSPSLQEATTLSYHLRLWDAWTAESALIYTHQNTAWNDITHDHLIDATDLINLNLSFAYGGLPVTPAVSLLVDNLTDQRKITSIRATVVAASALDSKTEDAIPTIYTQPRSFTLRFSLGF